MMPRLCMFLTFISILCACSREPGTVASHTSEDALSFQEAAGARVPWYTAIAPFSTKARIRKQAGKPSREDGDRDFFDQPQGQIVVTYKDGIVSDCTHENPGDAVSRSYYHSWSVRTGDDNAVTADQFVQSEDYAVVPKVRGVAVRTNAQPGICYRTSDGFIVVCPIIQLMGGTGFFADKTASVVHYCGGKRRLLYAASEHWQNLRPDSVDDILLAQRDQIIANSAGKVPYRSLLPNLGRPDSQMGSGIGYALYYTSSGLLVLSEIEGMQMPKGIIPGVHLVSPKSGSRE